MVVGRTPTFHHPLRGYQGHSLLFLAPNWCCGNNQIRRFSPGRRGVVVVGGNGIFLCSLQNHCLWLKFLPLHHEQNLPKTQLSSKSCRQCLLSAYRISPNTFTGSSSPWRHDPHFPATRGSLAVFPHMRQVPAMSAPSLFPVPLPQCCPATTVTSCFLQTHALSSTSKCWNLFCFSKAY